VLVAEAFGVTPTQAVAGALRRAAAAFGMAAEVEDLRPLPASDSRGLSSLFTVVGTLIPSVVFGVLLAMFGRALQARVRWTAVFAYALLAGLVVAFNVDVLVGALSGHFAGIAVVVGLFALAVGAVSHGLGHLGGPMAIAMVVVLLVLLGLSSAGGAVTYELEPGFFSAVSQLLPPGAALTAVRNVEYFDWAATTIRCWCSPPGPPSGCCSASSATATDPTPASPIPVTSPARAASGRAIDPGHEMHDVDDPSTDKEEP
jgi:hypothetical protein